MKSIHILLVEDNEGDILLTTDALIEGKLVNSVDVVKDGWEAVQYLEKKGAYQHSPTPDLILLDINLPKMNGHEVLKIIKNNPDIKHIPVVMLTTSSSEQDIMQSYQNYANSYISKPVELSDFLDAIAAIEHFWVSIVKLPTQINH